MQTWEAMHGNRRVIQIDDVFGIKERDLPKDPKARSRILEIDDDYVERKSRIFGYTPGKGELSTMEEIIASGPGSLDGLTTSEQTILLYGANEPAVSVVCARAREGRNGIMNGQKVHTSVKGEREGRYFDGLDPKLEFELTKKLMSILNKEKDEGETTATFEKRLKDDAEKVLKIKL